MKKSSPATSIVARLDVTNSLVSDSRKRSRPRSSHSSGDDHRQDRILGEYPLLGQAMQGEWRVFRKLIVSGYSIVYQLLPENQGIVISYIRFPRSR